MCHLGTFWCIFHKCSQLRAPLEIMFIWCAPVKLCLCVRTGGGLVLSLKSRIKLCFIRILFKLFPVTNGHKWATNASSATPLGYHFISFNDSCRAAYNWYNTILVVGLWESIVWFMPLYMDSVLNLPRPIYWFKPLFNYTLHEPWSLNSSSRQPKHHHLAEMSTVPGHLWGAKSSNAVLHKMELALICTKYQWTFLQRFLIKT